MSKKNLRFKASPIGSLKPILEPTHKKTHSNSFSISIYFILFYRVATVALLKKTVLQHLLYHFHTLLSLKIITWWNKKWSLSLSSLLFLPYSLFLLKKNSFRFSLENNGEAALSHIIFEAFSHKRIRPHLSTFKPWLNHLWGRTKI